MRHSGSFRVTQPISEMTWGLLPLAICFMVSISLRKSVRSLPVALAVCVCVCVCVCERECVGVYV